MVSLELVGGALVRGRAALHFSAYDNEDRALQMRYDAGMSLEQQLRRWVGAGAISSEQADRIRVIEQGDDRPTFQYAVAGLGGLAIAVGVMSLVAAHWGGIPGRVKIGVDLALVAALAAAVYRWDRVGPTWAREAGIIALWGLVLASIVLIGDVYRLGGEPDEALLTWTVLTALLMTRARSGLAATLWVLGLQVTFIAWMPWLADRTDSDVLAFATIFWPPLVCLALGRWPRLVRTRPNLAGVLAAIGWGELVLCATWGTFAFYDDFSRTPWPEAYPVVALSVLATLALAIRLPATVPERLLLLVCAALAHVPVMTSHGGLGGVAAVCFIGLWLTIAWVGHHIRDTRLLNVATAMIGLRILTIYLEMLRERIDTGLGLVGGGVLTLVLVWLWTRKRRQFAAEIGGAQ